MSPRNENGYHSVMLSRRVRSTAALVTVGAVGSLVGVVLTSSGAPKDTASVVRVVAAENVWGNLVAQLGGTRVRVTSIISSPNADPHEYVANAADAAAIASGRLVVENGAGYDAFMGQLVGGSGSRARILVVQQLVKTYGVNPNPHFWYDVPALATVAAAVASALESLDPKGSSIYRANLRAFDRSLVPLDALVARIRTRRRATRVAYTERVPGYLLAAAGLDVATPTGFARAIELGSEPSPADTVAMDALVSSRRVAVLLYNTQTVNPVTAAVRRLAIAHGIPVVGVGEVLPGSYRRLQDWLLAETVALARALGLR